MEENRSENPDGLPVVDPQLLVAAPIMRLWHLRLWNPRLEVVDALGRIKKDS